MCFVLVTPQPGERLVVFLLLRLPPLKSRESNLPLGLLWLTARGTSGPLSCHLRSRSRLRACSWCRDASTYIASATWRETGTHTAYRDSADTALKTVGQSRAEVVLTSSLGLEVASGHSACLGKASYLCSERVYIISPATRNCRRFFCPANMSVCDTNGRRMGHVARQTADCRLL